MSNGMVDIAEYSWTLTVEECGINEKVRFYGAAWRSSSSNGGGGERCGRLSAPVVDDLIPKHIIMDDIFAIYQLYDAAWIHGVGHHRRYRPSGQPPYPFGGRTAAEPVPHRFVPYGACHPRENDAQARIWTCHYAAGADQHPSGCWRLSRSSSAPRRCRSLWIRPTLWRN